MGRNNTALVIFDGKTRVSAGVTRGNSGVCPEARHFESFAYPDFFRVFDFFKLQTITKTPVDFVDEFTVILQVFIGPPVDGQETGVVFLDGFHENLPFTPVPPIPWFPIVGMLHNNGQGRPKTLGHIPMKPGTRWRSALYAVIPHGHPLAQGIVHHRIMTGGVIVAIDIITDAQLGVFEMSGMQIDVRLIRVKGIGHPAPVHGVPLAPGTKGSDIHKGHVRIVVIAFGHGPDEILQFLQEHGVIVHGFPGVAFFDRDP